MPCTSSPTPPNKTAHQNAGGSFPKFRKMSRPKVNARGQIHKKDAKVTLCTILLTQLCPARLRRTPPIERAHQNAGGSFERLAKKEGQIRVPWVEFDHCTHFQLL